MALFRRHMADIRLQVLGIAPLKISFEVPYRFSKVKEYLINIPVPPLVISPDFTKKDSRIRLSNFLAPLPTSLLQATDHQLTAHLQSKRTKLLGAKREARS